MDVKNCNSIKCKLFFNYDTMIFTSKLSKMDERTFFSSRVSTLLVIGFQFKQLKYYTFFQVKLGENPTVILQLQTSKEINRIN